MNQKVLEEKKTIVKEIVDKAKDSQSVMIVEYHALSVSDIQELRRALRSEGAEFCVYKNSLVTRAVKELGYEGFDEHLSGPNAVIFSKELTNGPKVAAKYAKRFGNNLNIKVGVAEGKTLDSKELLAIAKLPGKEGLLSMFLSCLQAPIRQFAATVKAVADAK